MVTEELGFPPEAAPPEHGTPQEKTHAGIQEDEEDEKEDDEAPHPSRSSRRRRRRRRPPFMAWFF